MKCPICSSDVGDVDLECPSCGEGLTVWRTIVLSSNQMLYRGRQLAAERDFEGACLSFLIAALTNPLDAAGLIDAAKALLRRNRVNDALRLLGYAQNRDSNCGAAAVADAIQNLAQKSKTAKRDGRKRQERAAPSAQASEPEADDGSGLEAPPRRAEPSGNGGIAQQAPAPARPLLAIGPLQRSAPWWKPLRRNQPLDAFWRTALAMEARWKGGWSGISEWLQTAADGGRGHAALRYMLGLALWQHGQVENARQCFESCIQTDPAVLNPGAYVLLLALPDSQKASQAVVRLRNHGYTSADLSEIQKRMLIRLAEWKLPDWTRGLHDAYATL